MHEIEPKNFLQQPLQKRKEENALRSLRKSSGLIDFASNDFLGLARSWKLQNEIMEEYQKAAKDFSPFLGSGGSRLLAGHHEYFTMLEKEIAAFHNAKAGLIFNSGYAANMGLLASLLGSKDIALVDSESHASVWDGIKCGKGKALVFRHNDPAHLHLQLQKASRNFSRIFVCIASLYSMSGDIAPLADICRMIKTYPAYLIVDEAHATGIFGPEGRGIAARDNLEQEIFARVHTFGKALGGCGAVVLGCKYLRDFLINFSRPFIYSTALPLYNLVHIRHAYKWMADAKDRRQNLQKLIAYFQHRSGGGKDNKKLLSPIQRIFVDGNQKADKLAENLRKSGMDVRPIKYPTVRKKHCCLRVCLHSFNTFSEIDRLLNGVGL